MARLAAAALCGAACASATTPLPANRPDDDPCITWQYFDGTKKVTNSSLFVFASKSTVFANEDPFTHRPTSCQTTLGLIFPCFGLDNALNQWGHHDWYAATDQGDHCRVQLPNGGVTYSATHWMPGKGPQWDKFKWVKGFAQQKLTSPGQIVQHNGFALVRSLISVGLPNCGHGFTGWAKLNADGTIDTEHYAWVDEALTSDEMEVAYCAACKPCPTSNPGPGCPPCPTPAPPTPKPTPKPTPAPIPQTPAPTPAPPLYSAPCLRFGHTIPAGTAVDALIEQTQPAGTNISFAWTDISYAQFSDWHSGFLPGEGRVTVWENTGGTRGKKLITVDSIPLTPGPLVVALKCSSTPGACWPPTSNILGENMETIAASFVPPTTTSAVRLFNLSPKEGAKDGAITAGLNAGGEKLATGIKYSLGSDWMNVPGGKSTTFTAVDEKSGSTVATVTTTTPPVPNVFTLWLLGDDSTKLQLHPMEDAPETGKCEPK